jgi:hypothetical protein
MADELRATSPHAPSPGPSVRDPHEVDPIRRDVVPTGGAALIATVVLVDGSKAGR